MDGVTQFWTVVLPLKGGPAAKSRLHGPPGLATAIALDCLDAVRQARQVAVVLVVTADDALGQQCVQLGASVVLQTGLGLTGAIEDGIAAADPNAPCAVLLGDLPALHPDDLDQALLAAQKALSDVQSVFVPDAEGTGTVLLAAGAPKELQPRFGPGSAAAHRATGAAQLDLTLPRLRRDVDTAADLAQALTLGAGPRTSALGGDSLPRPLA